MDLLFVPSPVPFRPHAPTWRQPLYLHFAPLWPALREALSALHGRVLDIGCGMQPYRAFLGPAVTEYVGLDRSGPYSNPTVEGTADALPFEAHTFDAAVSTQVLEHLIDPSIAVREAARVLRPGGTIVLTVPGVWPLHESPHDYWRFTRYGVQRLFDQADLALTSIVPLGGLWSSVGQMVNLELQRGSLTRQLVPLVNVAAHWLDRRGSSEELALAWLAIGTRKP